MIQGFLDLFEATTELHWLDEAVALQAQQDAHFLDAAGGYFRIADDAEPLLIRDKPLDDGAEPSGNAIAIRNLIRLELMTGDKSYRTRAEQALAAFASDLLTRGAGSPATLASLDLFHDSPLEIVLIGPQARTELKPLRDAVASVYVPNRILVTVVEGDEVLALAKKLPVLEDKRALRGTATAFVCEQRICLSPTSDPVELVKQLARVRPLLPNRSPAPL